MADNRPLQPIKPVPWLSSRFTVAVGALLGLLACAPGAPDAAELPRDSTGANTAALGNQPPLILVAAATPTRVVEGEPLTISVVATDPDGISDLIGGVVRPEVGRLVLGTLATTAEEGAYSLTIPWKTLEKVAVIDTPIAGKDINFEIEMFDASGASTVATVHAHMSCSNKQLALCRGVCTDLISDITNCGACGFDCRYNVGGLSNAASCESGRHCAKTERAWLDPISAPTQTCNERCAERAGTSATLALSESATLIPAVPGCIVNENTNFSHLPSSCYTEDSYIECTCVALYKTPASY